MRSVGSRVLVPALLGALLLSACSGTKGQPAGGTPQSGEAGAAPAAPAKKVQGSIVFSGSGDPVNFNPILSSDTSSSWVKDRVYSGLVTIDPGLNVVGDLATEWSSSGDGMTWTFKLRDGVKFHDGKPLTAEDVAYTYNAIKDPGYSGPRTSDFASLNRVEVVDPLTVKFIMNEPFAPMLSSLTYGILPKHLYADKPVAEMKDNPYNRKPIGSGPWKFGEWVSGQYIVLTRNDDFYGEGPYIPEVRLKFVQDTNVAVAQLEAGEIDLLVLPGKDQKRITTDYQQPFDFYKYDRLSFEYLSFNHTVPGLNEKAVRQAFAYAIDREKIISDLLEGQGFIMDGPLPPASWAYEPNLPQYRFNQQKAIEGLEKAGYAKGADGVYAKDGRRLSFTLITNTGNPTREAMALLIQKAMKDVGVEIKTEFIEWSVMLEKHLWVGNNELFISGFSLDIDPDGFSFFHSSQAEKNEQGRFKGFNRAQYKNPEIDRLLEAGRREMDVAVRKQIYSDYQKLVADDVPWLFLSSPKSTAAVKKQFKGVESSPLGLMEFHRWYVEDVQ